MGDDSLSSLIMIFALIALRGLLALAFGAFANIRPNVLREKAENGHKAASAVLALTEHSTRLQISRQVMTLLLDFAIASIAVLNFSPPLLKLLTSVAPVVIYALVVLLTICITLILGDLVPEAIGSAYAQPLAFWLVVPVRLLYNVLSPVTLALVAISRWVSSVFSSSEKVNVVTEEEIMTMLESGHSGGAIEEEEKEMIFSVLQLDETYASEVMVPRIDIKALEIDTPLEEARAAFVQTGYSRIPIYDGTIDNIKGLLYAKDLLNHWRTDGKECLKSIQELLRPAYFVPETKPVDELLKELQSKRVHMAIVVDEYGGTAGIVTIENIIEEIIGDIRDEYDPEEEAEYTRISDTEYVVDAGIDIDDFNDLLDVSLPNDDTDTLGGFIYTYFGRVPVVGEEINETEHHLILRVDTVDGRRIRKVHVTRLIEPDDPNSVSDTEPLSSSASDETESDIRKTGETARFQPRSDFIRNSVRFGAKA